MMSDIVNLLIAGCKWFLKSWLLKNRRNALNRLDFTQRGDGYYAKVRSLRS
jgi:hypothetical protein